ncbi:molecular chaperone [Pseudomonas sp. Irchel 3H7]|uniref:fimbrial biogenesis chaperone n=1 Tax=Pseudomonas sp. Irchel 3H7 TaxID=2009042 RepID=UPI000BA4749C|nr:fimbria/pilus periplasmic chaperone [Pseudomonas sp. Irchel 3H7]
MFSITVPNLRRLSAGLLFLSLAPYTWAGVVIEGTRVIYAEKERAVTVKMTNKGKDPVLMEVWADRGNIKSKPQTADAPFLITPPIFRLDSQKGQSVRLVFTGEDLPKDRESLFWFNALEIPSMPKAANSNFMQIAVRSRLKLFYRPAGLSGSLDKAVDQVKWEIINKGSEIFLKGDNPSPYYLTYSNLDLVQGGKSYPAANGMIAPFSSELFKLSDVKVDLNNAQLRYRWMSDYGAGVEREVRLK